MKKMGLCLYIFCPMVFTYSVIQFWSSDLISKILILLLKIPTMKMQKILSENFFDLKSQKYFDIDLHFSMSYLMKSKENWVFEYLLYVILYSEFKRPVLNKFKTGVQKCSVVSIDLFWFCFVPFSYHEVYFLWQTFSSAQSVIVNSNTLFLHN